MDTFLTFLLWTSPVWVILLVANASKRIQTWQLRKWVEAQVSAPPSKLNMRGYLEVSSTFLAEASRYLDEIEAAYLEVKRHPARKAAEKVREISSHKRVIEKKLHLLEGELLYLSNIFPPIFEAWEYYLTDDEFLNRVSDTDDIDPITRYLDPDEYKGLSDWQKSDLALRRYLDRSHSQLEIGRMHERYLGYLYEKEGWEVQYRGLIDGYEDMGRDLICRRDNMRRNRSSKVLECKKANPGKCRIPTIRVYRSLRS